MTSRWTRVPAASRRTAAAVVLLLGATTAACSADPVDPERAGTVVVTTDLPFASLNGGTPAGRSPGSVLVRGLVQSGFTTLGPDGSVTPDPTFGTVEKVADSPLTVRYTVAPTATWSDGVPVTPADLLLEWAARSGQLDEVVPELGGDGEPVEPADDVVLFGATSAALVRASAVPVVDGATLTVVYDVPVADWQVALDVNLPAHVVGRLALDPTAPAFPAPAPAPTPTPSDGAAPTGEGTTSQPAPSASAASTPAQGTPTPGTPTPGTPTPGTPTPDATTGEGGGEVPDTWAQAVATAVQQQDRAALTAISRVWRAAGRAGDVGADPTLTTTTGPYVLTRVDADGVEVARSAAYTGAAPAAFDRVRVRTDLDPLAQVEALASDDVDVVAPVSTADVLAGAEALEDVALRTGGDAVLQVVLQEAGGGVFDPAAHAADPDPAATAAALRRGFVGSVPRADVADVAVRPLWARTEPSDVVAAQVGPTAPTVRVPDVPADGATAGGATSDGAQDPPTVRVLTNRSDPVRAAAFELLSDAAAEAGYRVVAVAADDPARALRTRAEDWDAALVPVAQEELPVAGFVSRWRTGGATNVGGHADPALDTALDALAGQPDAEAAADAVRAASQTLLDSGAVLPVVRTPVLTVAAVRDPQDARGLPVVADVPPLTPAAADLTWWWDWTRR
ncbi:hypothetical protein J1G43_16655 [Cellulomonas sp. zg-ZUI22]|uniref:ABC transporter substrate-binding protein n=1 Tax=Cellulomonas sp. zg-ZUI22 TaxID=2816955 RepID=UPI001A949059|nr:ABC transporter substrate-binding protein [Cellulomonas sp. zg-ZUI22]MBO0901595.1 hypothetical protein [Cellulomonas sp. zg-ZUI22]